MSTVLALEDLRVRFATADGGFEAVRGVSLELEQSETHALVGESGSGKTQVFLALMGLLSANGTARGRAYLNGVDVLSLPRAQLDRLRGRVMSMIFQDPMSSLNPSMRIGAQLAELPRRHLDMTARAARVAALEMLRKVGVPDAHRRMSAYPHQMSGGMRQRVMIAMALICRPKLLIADEPTTALDATIQAQILELFEQLREEFSSTLVLITHDLGVVAQLCERMSVMYAGKIVESGPVAEVFARPAHPYTLGLLHSTPRAELTGSSLQAIPGSPPARADAARGCAFRPRCPFALAECAHADPLLKGCADGRIRACHAPPPDKGEVARFVDFVERG